MTTTTDTFFSSHTLSPEAEDRIQLLTETARLLDIDDLSFQSYSTALTHLFSRQLTAKQSLLRLSRVESELKNHLAAAKHEDYLISKWTQTIQDEKIILENAATVERRRDALVKKAKEYRKELDTIMASMPPPPPVTVSDLQTLQEKNRQQEQSLKIKRAKVKAFQGLPPNLALARQQLVEARNTQYQLIQLRERLLGRMADGVA